MPAGYGAVPCGCSARIGEFSLLQAGREGDVRGWYGSSGRLDRRRVGTLAPLSRQYRKIAKMGHLGRLSQQRPPRVHSTPGHVIMSDLSALQWAPKTSARSNARPSQTEGTDSATRSRAFNRVQMVEAAAYSPAGRPCLCRSQAPISPWSVREATWAAASGVRCRTTWPFRRSASPIDSKSGGSSTSSLGSHW